MQGARTLRNEAYLPYAGMTKGEVEHRRWTFYEAVSFDPPHPVIPALRTFTCFRKPLGLAEIIVLTGF